MASLSRPYEPRHEKTCLCHMRTTKAQICASDQHFVVRCLDSIKPLLAIAGIPSKKISNDLTST